MASPSCGIWKASSAALLLLLFASSPLAPAARGQSAPKTQRRPASLSAETQHAIDLVSQGRCAEALPLLQSAIPRLKDKDNRYSAAMAEARCAMSLHRSETAIGALVLLNREFPRDPEVLYITSHYYSELANHAAQVLAATSPTSYQAHELNAEADESQGKWDQAQAEYEAILKNNPKLPGIHYRLARVLLSKSDSPSAADIEQGRQNLEEELKIDPTNASAEFMLGELARRESNWDEAAAHFSRATQLDEGFSEAFLALGISLNAAGKFGDAVAPLRSYEKMMPDDPAGHYQLAIAYSRTGRKEDASREMALQRETTEKLAKAPEAAQELAAPH